MGERMENLRYGFWLLAFSFLLPVCCDGVVEILICLSFGVAVVLLQHSLYLVLFGPLLEFCEGVIWIWTSRWFAVAVTLVLHLLVDLDL
jgi:hypothetical protein